MWVSVTWNKNISSYCWIRFLFCSSPTNCLKRIFCVCVFDITSPELSTDFVNDVIVMTIEYKDKDSIQIRLHWNILFFNKFLIFSFSLFFFFNGKIDLFIFIFFLKLWIFVKWFLFLNFHCWNIKNSASYAFKNIFLNLLLRKTIVD